MADGFSVTWVTDKVTTALADRQAKMRLATMYALRESGRTVQRTARAKAPVWKGRDGSTTVAQARRGARFRTAGGIGPIQGQDGGPVVGLLRDSIRPAKKLNDIPSGWSLKIAPRGPRVHLYAGKQEARAHFMAAGKAEAEAAAGAIARSAYEKVWKA